ncbi:hypothetical protein [Bacillus thuringiensis]|uniref:hypothetical protein n=2 Tax=Bacillus cereus group TaxID=86661 RepID=UPI000A37ADDC|nr:hypothetical protein [Bacillus thuringiensis]OUA65522.1 hypothetical protein BK781_03025 [Bacillus thuringiensis serovar aizawai]
MKKIMLTSILSLGTLMTVNLPGLDYITVHAAGPSKIAVTDFSYSQQVLLEKQYQKEMGTVIEKNEDHLTLSNGNLTIKAFVSDNVLKEVNVGDTVNVYAPDFGPSMMINAPLIARDAIIQKIGEKNFLEKQYQKETGTVIEKNEDYLTVSNGNLTIEASVSDNVLKEVNVGDTVNVYAPDFGPSMMINAPLIARDAIIQKIDSQEKTSKVNEEKNEDFIIGTVMTSAEYFVTVEYKNMEGKSELVDIDFSKDHNFKQGDKVKVTNKGKWEHRKIGLHNVTSASENSISKINEKQNEDFIIGTVMTSAEYFVTVEYKNMEGKSELVDIDFSKGHNFKQGDKVKVTNKGKWEHRKIGLHNVTSASEDSISKINEKQK